MDSSFFNSFTNYSDLYFNRKGCGCSLCSPSVSVFECDTASKLRLQLKEKDDAINNRDRSIRDYAQSLAKVIAEKNLLKAQLTESKSIQDLIDDRRKIADLTKERDSLKEIIKALQKDFTEQVNLKWEHSDRREKAEADRDQFAAQCSKDALTILSLKKEIERLKADASIDFTSHTIEGLKKRNAVLENLLKVSQERREYNLKRGNKLFDEKYAILQEKNKLEERIKSDDDSLEIINTQANKITELTRALKYAEEAGENSAKMARRLSDEKFALIKQKSALEQKISSAREILNGRYAITLNVT